MTTMFGIPKSKIHKVRDPYKPTEILKKFDEETTAFVTVVGEKDKSRLRLRIPEGLKIGVSCLVFTQVGTIFIFLTRWKGLQ